jgi:hypothetical protein
MPQLAAVALWKFAILQLLIVFPLFSSPAVAVPLQYRLTVGVVAPSSMSQLSIMLLSLPVVPVVVLKSMVPDVALVFTPVIVQYCIVLSDASLLYTIVFPVTAVFSIVRDFVVPAPPALPSIVRYRAPESDKVAVAPEEIVKGPAVAAGRMIRVLVLVVVRPVITIGKVSPPLV